MATGWGRTERKETALSDTNAKTADLQDAWLYGGKASGYGRQSRYGEKRGGQGQAGGRRAAGQDGTPGRGFPEMRSRDESKPGGAAKDAGYHATPGVQAWLSRRPNVHHGGSTRNSANYRI